MENSDQTDFTTEAQKHREPNQGNGTFVGLDVTVASSRLSLEICMMRSESGDERDPLTNEIIGLAIEVHRGLGPGLLESAYEACLCYELEQQGVPFRRQVRLPVVYKEVTLDCGYRMDLVVDETVIVELKVVEKLMPIHEAQLIKFLKLSGLQTGLLLNFNTPVLKHGIRRVVL